MGDIGPNTHHRRGAGIAKYLAAQGASVERPIDNVAQHFDVAIHQVRAGTPGSAVFKLQSEMPAPRSVMEIDELTVLTGWAQALTEAVAYAPECVKPLFADAHAGATWRADLGIIEPSQPLSEAISLLDRIVQAVARLENPPTVDALLGWCREQPSKQGLEGPFSVGDLSAERTVQLHHFCPP